MSTKQTNSHQVVLRVPKLLRAEIERLAEEDRRCVADCLRILIADAIAARRAQQQRQGKAAAA